MRSGGREQSFLGLQAFAYHLDNKRLVEFLRQTAVARGITHLDCKVVDAELSREAESGEPTVTALLAEDGRRLEFDLYVDCSGFRSFLLGDKLGERFHSFTSSLFTDRALAFNAPHGGELKPYTTARTMQHGWCWNIPIMEDDHLGYVHSSSHCSEDEALAEAKAVWPDLTGERMVKFRSGRHDRLWVGNVYAVGNAYAFVEPLTGIAVGQCVDISRLLENHLDGSGMLSENYTLDVSSPGTSNPLVVPRQYKRRIGRTFDIVKTDGTALALILVGADDTTATFNTIVKPKKKKKGQPEQQKSCLRPLSFLILRLKRPLLSNQMVIHFLNIKFNHLQNTRL